MRPPIYRGKTERPGVGEAAGEPGAQKPDNFKEQMPTAHRTTEIKCKLPMF